MNTAPHPTDEVLAAYGLGQAETKTAETVVSHLKTCIDCRLRVAELSGSSFAARSGGTSPGGPALPSDVVPPELAKHKDYTDVRVLGRGGMGVVYVGKQIHLDRWEALKIIKPEKAGTVDRFLQEIRAAAKLQSEYVVAAYNAFKVGELYVFAMEYVPGVDLAQLVKDLGPLPVHKACQYVCNAAVGLQHALTREMVHRDIKPGNLILTRQGKKSMVKILDFGLAKAKSEKETESNLTGDGKMLGTPDYMAPEQSLDATKADIRADIYSLGCTLYTLLHGKAPFPGRTAYEVINAHHTKIATPLDKLRPDVPAALAAVVAKMMAKKPADRYPTPGDVFKALADFVKVPVPTAKPPEVKTDVKSDAKPAEPKKQPPPLNFDWANDGRVEKPTAVKPVVPAVQWDRTFIEDAATPSQSKMPSLPPVPVEDESPLWLPKTVPQSQHDERDDVTPKKSRALLFGGLAASVLALALVGAWAGGVFKGKTTPVVKVDDASQPNTSVEENRNTETNLKKVTKNPTEKVDAISITTVKPKKDNEIVIAPAPIMPMIPKPDPSTLPPAETMAAGVPPPKSEPKIPQPPKPEPASPLYTDRSVKAKTGARWLINQTAKTIRQANTAGENYLIFGDPTWNNVTIKVTAKIDEEALAFVGQQSPRLQVLCLVRIKKTTISTFAPYIYANKIKNAVGAPETRMDIQDIPDLDSESKSTSKRLFMTITKPMYSELEHYVDDSKPHNYVIKIKDGLIDFDVAEGRRHFKLATKTTQGMIGLRTVNCAATFSNIKVTDADGTVRWEGVPDK